jgi:hypothetical protein
VFRRDYIERQIKALAEAIARSVGLRAKGELDEAQNVIAEAYRTLAIDSSFLRLDATSLCAIVGDPDKLRLLAQLLREEGELFEARGDVETARRKRHLADEIQRRSSSASNS